MINIQICIGNSFLWAQNHGGNKGFNRKIHGIQGQSKGKIMSIT